MKKRTGRKILNIVMLLSLIIVMVSGMLLHGMDANMWIGITHGVSGIVLTIAIIIHCFQHRKSMF